ncbi:MAG: HAMP domain-containing histidine kinase [Muribaculum sp.]|nr:HAMP domain-containing histidine kinase [Muribaculum sp.]
MKKFKINSIIFISVIAVIFCCNVYYLVNLYNSIREDVEREVLTALADTDIDDMWERAEKARRIARESGLLPVSQEEADSIYSGQRGTISGKVDDDGNFETSTIEEDGEVTVQRAPLKRNRSYTNQMMKAMSQQMHEAMDKYYGYDLSITDSIFKARLADRGIFPDIVSIDIVDQKDSILLSSSNRVLSNSDLETYKLCFNPEKGWLFKASMTPLTRHILSQMMGVIITIFLLMVAFSAAFWYLFRTVSKLRTIEEMKDDFVSNMTHELKTPIAIAYSANDALLNYDTTNDQEKKTAYLTIAIKQLKRLGELVENILAMSLERRKTMTLKPENIDLPELVEEITSAQQMRGDKDISIEVQTKDDVTIYADKSHLSNVLNNLIDNAIKYSNDSVRINIEIERNSISVSDNGMGIPQKSLPYIFDKFYRVPHGNRQDVRGYGIGLYYVKHIIEKMGWSISVKSQQGLGSTFTIKFDNHES